MPSIPIDFRFVEIYYEIAALGEYLNVLERQLPFLKVQERERVHSWLGENERDSDEAEVDLAQQDLRDLVDHVLPRFFRGPFLVSLWAVYEAGVTEIATYLQKRLNIVTSMPTKGDGFLQRAKKYFRRVLNFSLCNDNRTWERLEMLRILRNALAHGNGRMAAINNQKDRQKIEKWIKLNIGISTVHDDLVFSEQFTRETYEAISKSLTDLLNRVRSTK
jgi:hypothetical protein